MYVMNVSDGTLQYWTAENGLRVEDIPWDWTGLLKTCLEASSFTGFPYLFLHLNLQVPPQLVPP